MDSVRYWNIQHLGGTKSCHHRQLVFTNGHCGFVFGIEGEDICGWYVFICPWPAGCRGVKWLGNIEDLPSTIVLIQQEFTTYRDVMADE